MQCKKYFFDVSCSENYGWSDCVEWLPSQIKSKAKAVLNQKRFAYWATKITVLDFETEEVVFVYERQPLESAVADDFNSSSP